MVEDHEYRFIRHGSWFHMIIDWAYFASLSQQTNEFVTWDSRATILKLLISMFMRADISLLQHIDTLLTISLMVKILSASAVKNK